MNLSAGPPSCISSSFAVGRVRGNDGWGAQCAARLSGHAESGFSDDVRDVYMNMQENSNRWNEVGTARYRQSLTPTGQILLALWSACWFQTFGTKTPAKSTSCTLAGSAALNKSPPESGVLYPVSTEDIYCWTNPCGQGGRGNTPAFRPARRYRLRSAGGNAPAST